MAEAAAPPDQPLRRCCRRRRRRRLCPPNPLFTRWIREWREEAAGTPLEGTYRRALHSLSLYPLPLPSGKAAAILRHFGPGLCRRLQLRLQQHRAEHGLPSSPSPKRPQQDDAPMAVPHPRPYRPRPNSAGHALLIALHESLEPLEEEELQRRIGQSEPSQGLSKPLRTLLRQELLRRSGRPPRYSLTPEGHLLAQRLAAASSTPPPPLTVALPAPNWDFQLLPGTFEVTLCIDCSEEKGPGPLLLGALGGPCSRRRLPLGDFLWVARERDPPQGHPPRELVLDVVVERKTAADLGRSLVDGRYREQKFRLSRSGLRNPILLLEGLGRGQGLPLPLPTLRQAAASSQVGGFLVHCTGGPQESAQYLQLLGKRLRRHCQGRALKAWGGPLDGRGPPGPPGAALELLPWERLCRGGGKIQPQTVGDVFVRQLLQLGGVSAPRAGAILSRFPTPASLLAAFSGCSDPSQCQRLLKELPCGPLGRNLGPSLSKALVQLYRTPGALQ